MKRIIGLLNIIRSRNGFGANVIMLTGGTAAGRVLMFAALPLLSRLYTPDQVGIWQLFLSAFIAIHPFITWGYDRAVVLPEKDEDAVNVLVISGTITALMTVLMFVLSGLLDVDVVKKLGLAELSDYLWLVPLAAFFMGCELTGTHWLTRNNRFSALAAASFLRPVATVLTAVAAALILTIGAEGLIFGSLVGYGSACCLIIYMVILRGSGVPLEWIKWSSIRKQLLNYMNYPLYVAPYNFIGAFSNRLLYFLLAAYAGNRTVGLFAFSMQVVFVPITFISGALRDVFFPRASREKDPEVLGLFVFRMLRLMIFASAPALVFFIFQGPEMLTFILGDNWREMGPFSLILAGPAFILFHISWLDRLYDVAGRQRAAVILQLVYDVIALGLFIAMLELFDNPLFAVGSYSVFTVAFRIFWLIFTFKISGFRLDYLTRLGLQCLALIFVFTILFAAVERLAQPPFGIIIESGLLLCYYSVFGIIHFVNRARA